jgi:phosphatidylglycerol:prolipoprotein diacylglycerol transferase
MYPIFFRIPEWFPLLGGAPITSFGVFMFLTFMVGGLVLRPEVERAGLEPEKAWDFIVMGVLGGILGAKAYYVLLNYGSLITDPIGSIFSRGGMVWYGGFLGGLIAVSWEVNRSGLRWAQMADLIAPVLAIGYAVGRMGCFFVGDDYGRPTDAWFGVKFPQGAPPTRASVMENHFGIEIDPYFVERFGEVIPVHPTQLYEVAISLMIFGFLWRIRKHNYAEGWIWWIWFVLAGAERFLVEFVRLKDDRFLGIFTVAQLISLLLIVIGIWGIVSTMQTKNGDVEQFA